MTQKKEIEYYDEISEFLTSEIQANLGRGENITVDSIMDELHTGLKTLEIDGRIHSGLLHQYAQQCNTLYIDIAIVIQNKTNDLFEIINFEIKREKKLGLTNLSQLIGYCLVSDSRFGVLVNVDHGCSEHFKSILNTDKDLTNIHRIKENQVVEHKFGVMVWESKTKNMTYTNEGSILTIPKLCEMLRENLRIKAPSQD